MAVAVTEAWHGSPSADAAELVDPVASAAEATRAEHERRGDRAPPQSVPGDEEWGREPEGRGGTAAAGAGLGGRAAGGGVAARRGRGRRPPVALQPGGGAGAAGRCR